MRRKLILGVLAGLLALLVWAWLGSVPTAPLSAQILYRTNVTTGRPSYVLAVTNRTGQGMMVSGNGDYWRNGSWQLSTIRGRIEDPMKFFWTELPAQTGTWIRTMPESNGQGYVEIYFHRYSAWDKFLIRASQWTWLPGRFRPSNKIMGEPLTIPLPPE